MNIYYEIKIVLPIYIKNKLKYASPKLIFSNLRPASFCMALIGSSESNVNQSERAYVTFITVILLNVFM